MMRVFAAFVLLAVFASLASGLWYHSTDILVQDTKNRPVPHARVIATWQLSGAEPSHGQTGYTDYMGIYHLNMSNYVQLEQAVSRIVKVTAEYGDGALLTRVSGSFDISAHAEPFPLTMPLYKVKVKVVSDSGWPIKGAKVYLAPWTFETDSSGSVSFMLPAASTSAVIAVGDVKQTEPVQVNGDTSLNITLPLYDLRLFIVDHEGTPLTATVTDGNTTKTTDSRGFFEFKPYMGDPARLTIRAKGIDKKIHVVMNREREIRVVFDLAPPEIKDVSRLNIEGGRKAIGAEVTDEGKYASGLKSVSVIWFVDGRQQDTLEMYAAGSDLFRATLPSQPPGTSVSYYMVAEDKKGNQATSPMEKYEIPPIGPPPEDNQTATGGGGIDLGWINWWYVIGLGAVLIFAIVFYIYWKGD